MITLEQMQENLGDLKSVRFTEDAHRGVTIVCYMIDDPEIWKRDLGTEARGIVFDSKTGQCLCRPFKKFFNFHEFAGDEQQLMRKSIGKSLFPFFEKVDGSLLTPVLFPDGRLEFKSKKSFDSDLAVLANHIYLQDEKLVKACSHMLAHGLQPIFEFTHPEWKIVLDYGNNPGLFMIGVRDIENGVLQSYDTILELADEFLPKGIAVNRAFHFDNDEVLFNTLKNEKGIEGFVGHFGDTLVKFKTEWYLERHRILDIRERDIADMVIDETFDDLKENLIMANVDMDYVERIARNVRNELLAIVSAAGSATECAKQECGEDRKGVALYIQHHVPALMAPAMAFYEGNTDKAISRCKSLWKERHRENYPLRSIANKNF